MRVAAGAQVLTTPAALTCYGYDSSFIAGRAGAVVLASSARQVRAVAAWSYRRGIPLVPRGAGTGLAGGSVPMAGSVVLSLERMNAIVHVDQAERLATVEAGVVTADLHRRAEAMGLFYPPDPASSDASTLGGNIAAGAGGPRGLKYGVTRGYVHGLDLVLPGGEELTLGGGVAPGLCHLFTGSEGTLGIITRAVLRLIPRPEYRVTMLAVFDVLEDAAHAINDIMATGVVPSTLEIMDQASIRCVESYAPSGLPLDAAALLLIETDGMEKTARREARAVIAACRQRNARQVHTAANPVEAARLWKGRKAIPAAVVRVRPVKISEDATVPRSRVPEFIVRLHEIGHRHRLPLFIWGHAGDGNLHPNLVAHPGDPDELHRAQAAVADLFAAALELGGTLSGEHGVGLAKAPFLPGQAGPPGIDYMRRVRRAFDPRGLMNPGKIIIEG
ncbi:MAG: FAD-linked oxidase C-terminal domain-containing protein [Bacillota bacterium]